MACKFAAVGCEVATPNHDEKRPVKHLSLLNDEMRTMNRQFEKLLDTDSDYFSNLTALRISVNSAQANETPQLLWRIEGWQEKARAAQVRLQPWILSPPFSTDAYGYRMIASVAPFGFDRSFGKALSVFVQIMPGEFDAVLPWPFRKTVKFTLFDQQEAPLRRQHYQLELPPEQVTNQEIHCCRPTKFANPAFGCQLFCPLSVLTDPNFVVNDSILIGVTIH